MQEVSQDLVNCVFVSRYLIKDPSTYPTVIAQVKAVPLKKRLKIPFENRPELVEDYSKHKALWDDVFLSHSIKWFLAEVSEQKNVVNKIYKKLFHTSGFFGASLESIATGVEMSMFPKGDETLIKTIQHTLLPDPRVVMLTNDFKVFVILDGWHTAVAFALEKKPIPAFVGVMDKFNLPTI